MQKRKRCQTHLVSSIVKDVLIGHDHLSYKVYLTKYTHFDYVSIHMQCGTNNNEKRKKNEEID